MDVLRNYITNIFGFKLKTFEEILNDKNDDFKLESKGSKYFIVNKDKIPKATLKCIADCYLSQEGKKVTNKSRRCYKAQQDIFLESPSFCGPSIQCIDCHKKALATFFNGSIDTFKK